VVVPNVELALQTGDRHCLFLQDDVQIAPDFWPQLREMLSEAPDEIIGLESVTPLHGR